MFVRLLMCFFFFGKVFLDGVRISVRMMSFRLVVEYNTRLLLTQSRQNNVNFLLFVLV
jgi:hypothetical protein